MTGVSPNYAILDSKNASGQNGLPRYSFLAEAWPSWLLDMLSG
jgi:hypothetical protein